MKAKLVWQKRCKLWGFLKKEETTTQQGAKHVECLVVGVKTTNNN